MAMLRLARRTGRSDLVRLVVSVRSPDDLLYAAELPGPETTIVYTRRRPAVVGPAAGPAHRRRPAGIRRGGHDGLRVRLGRVLQRRRRPARRGSACPSSGSASSASARPAEAGAAPPHRGGIRLRAMRPHVRWLPSIARMGRLDALDLTQRLGRIEYEDRLAAAQRRWLQLRLHLGGQMGVGRARPGAAARVRGPRRRRQGRGHQARRASRSTRGTTACRRSPSRRSTRSATRSCGASTG